MSGGDWKAMFKGIQVNDLELVKFYLRTGVDPNYQHPEFMALPLAESIRYNHIEIVEILLSHGAKPQIIEMETGKTCIELAEVMKNEKALTLLKGHAQG
ncbi:MAG: ankyrin repeat domain-containing protein [Bacteroidota bacterium]